MNKKTLFILTLILFIPQIILTQEYIKLSFVIPPKNLSVKQGDTNSTIVYIENNYNETVLWISLKFENPSGIEISTRPEIIEELYPDSKKPFRIFLNASDTISPGNYTIEVWAESLMELDDNYIQSERHSFNLEVIKVEQNQILVNETTTIETTTTTEITTTSTTIPTTTTIKSSKISMNLRIPLAIAIIFILIVSLLIFLRR